MTWAGTALVLGTDIGQIWQVDAEGEQTQLADVGGVVVALAANDEAVYAASSRPGRLLRFPLGAPQQLEDFGEPGAVIDAGGITVGGKTLFFTDFHNGRVLALRDSKLHEVAAGLSNPGSLARATDGTLYVAEFGRGAVTRILS